MEIMRSHAVLVVDCNVEDGLANVRLNLHLYLHMIGKFRHGIQGGLVFCRVVYLWITDVLVGHNLKRRIVEVYPATGVYTERPSVGNSLVDLVPRFEFFPFQEVSIPHY